MEHLIKKVKEHHGYLRHRADRVRRHRTGPLQNLLPPGMNSAVGWALTCGWWPSPTFGLAHWCGTRRKSTWASPWHWTRASDLWGLRWINRAGQRNTSFGPAPADIICEATFHQPADGEPAASHVRWALESGRTCAPPIKSRRPARRRTRGLARQKGLHFEFEGAVMSGTPVLRLAKQLFPGLALHGSRGSSTAPTTTSWEGWKG